MESGLQGLEFAAAIAAECSSPVRLQILRLLLEEGESRVRIMAEQLGVGESALSNHLKRLRDAGIVDVARVGRTATYSIADPRVGDVVASLLSAAGLAPEYPVITGGSGMAHARSCYDHLAGEVGVQLTRGLIRAGAIVVVGEGDAVGAAGAAGGAGVAGGRVGGGASGAVELGPNAEKVFARLGVGLTGMPGGRKQSFLCDDWSHSDKHLAGALGAVLLQGLMSKGFIETVPGSRQLTITPAGATALAEFGVG